MRTGAFAARFALIGLGARAAVDALSELLPVDIAITAFERAPGAWEVELLCGAPPDLSSVRALVEDVAGADAAQALAFAPLPEKDWVAESLAGLSPVRAGRFVVHGAHDRGRAPPACVAIEIEAGLAFGTGHHATTRGCLLALDALLKAGRPRRVLDVGTGTGVLAIAAARALRRPVRAGDIDAVAVRVARANARHNGVDPLVETTLAAGIAARWRGARRHGLVFANILLRPLLRLAVDVAAITAPGSVVILSGLLAAQANAALAAYRMQGLYLVRRIEVGGWATLVLVRGKVRARRQTK